MFSQDAIRALILFVPLIVVSLSIHEWAHAKVADKLGDATAKYLGRMTIDPMAHISWVGTVLFPSIAVLTGAPLFGWAKPVPVDMRNFKNPRQGMALVAAAGPASNIVIAVILAAILGYLTQSQQMGLSTMREQEGLLGAGSQMLLMGIQLNAFLAFFNLIPIPPLDGSRIIAGLGGNRAAEILDRIEPYGFMILLLVFFGGFIKYLTLPVFAFITFLMSSFGVVF